MIKRFYFYLILLIATINIAIAQQNTANIWYFAQHAGINFNTGIPVAITDGQTNTLEGCATLCDINGNLIFYTDGTKVWNRNHQLMPNGSGLMGNSSAAQSGLICPYPSNDSLYLIFTIDARENSLQNGLRYSVININLDGGLGDIISTEKNILLHAPVCEKLTSVIKGNQHDYWIIVHDWGNNDFLAYSVTNTGVDTTPIISSIGAVSSPGGDFSYQCAIGCMKASMNGQKIAIVNYWNSGFFELFDFNDATGILSNVQTSPSIYYRPYGVEFSPDGNILYGSIDGQQTGNGQIYQFDLTSPTPLNNGVLVGTSTKHLSGMQIGPNGKIYVAIHNYGYVGVIDKPNSTGYNCNFIHDAVFLDGATSQRGLPSLFYHKGFQFFTGSEVDTTICSNDSIFFDDIYQTVAGTYYDTLISSLGWDSIITLNLNTLSVLPTPTISENGGILTTSPATYYQWYFNGNPIVGANSQMYQPFIDGNYQVAVDNGNGCKSFSDLYYFDYVSNQRINIGESSISVFPNPSKGILFIKNNDIDELEVISMDGQVLKNIKNIGNKKNIMIRVLDIPKGIYILRIKRDKIDQFTKIIIQ